MSWLGFTIGRLFGWTPLESLFAGAVIAISSTTIIAKAFEEQGITGKLRELVVGVLIVEDLIAVLLMAVLTAIASGTGLAAGPLVATIARLAAFLVGLVGIGLLLVPRAMRAIIRIQSFWRGVCHSHPSARARHPHSVSMEQPRRGGTRHPR